MAGVVEGTEGFSFAYLKELFLSSLLRWVATQQAGAMEGIMRHQTGLLREQMVTARDGAKGKKLRSSASSE